MKLLASVLALLVASAPAHAQWPAAGQLPEPQLVDTPWGDFPLERLQPGARLRLTSADGRQMEVRLAALVDSTLDIRSAGGDSLPPLTFADLRALRSVEVRARLTWRERAGNIGFVTGAVLGALAGAAAHKSPSRSAAERHHPSMGEDVAAGASVGLFVGWMTGRAVVARARWRTVMIP